jgi:putative transposon-encoded protein
MGISLDLYDLGVFDKIPSNFGNSSHVFVPKELIGKKLKIIVGKCKISKDKIKLDLFDSEILEREVRIFSTGAHIILPKEYSGKKIKLIFEKNE